MSLEVDVARVEGKVDNLAEVLRRVEVQTTKTNGRVDKAEVAIEQLQSKDVARLAAEAVRAELAAVTRREHASSRAARFNWVSAAGTIGGLIVGAVAAAIAAGVL